MRALLAAIFASIVCFAGAFLPNMGGGNAGNDVFAHDSNRAASPDHLVVHEWGTFTSFSGSDGKPVGFSPNNSDLPSFVYRQVGEYDKGARLQLAGTVSMETPVIYFYAEKEMQSSIRVNFPSGWITEWYPFASKPPSKIASRSISWDVKIQPGQTAGFPREKDNVHYYQARETDASPLQVKFPPNPQDRSLQDGKSTQQEKFLFYRGVGAFDPLVAVRAVGEGYVRVTNNMNDRVVALMLVSVRDGRLAFKTLGGLDARKELETSLPESAAEMKDLASEMVKELTATGLFEKEARAMVKTWDSAWFGENGVRLLYLVPRSQTDKLLPLSIEPKPSEVVRVLVGRHDFLTPEQEAVAERQVERIRMARSELEASEKELLKLGRFADQAGQLAQKRLDKRAAAGGN